MGSIYPAPTANLTVFNPYYYTADDSNVTISEGDARWLKLTGGTESGTVTFSSGLISNGNVNLNTYTNANVFSANVFSANGNVTLKTFTTANVFSANVFSANVFSANSLSIS